MREKARRKAAMAPVGNRQEFTIDFVASWQPEGYEGGSRLLAMHTIYPENPEWNTARLSLNYDNDDGYLDYDMDPLKTTFEQLVVMAKQLTWRTVHREDLEAIGWRPA